MKPADLFVHSDHTAWGMFVYSTVRLMPHPESKFKRELKKQNTVLPIYLFFLIFIGI